MKIIKGFNFRFKIANLDTSKNWQVQIYAGKASYEVVTEWLGTELICTLSAEVTDTMSVGYYNILIFEGDNTIPPKCNVFEVIDAKNGGC